MADGYVLMAGSFNDRIRRFTVSDSCVARVCTVAGGGRPDWKDGIGELARLDTPLGLAVDTQGNVWIAHAGNHALRRLTLQRERLTVLRPDPEDIEADLRRPLAVAAAPGAARCAGAGAGSSPHAAGRQRRSRTSGPGGRAALARRNPGPGARGATAGHARPLAPQRSAHEVVGTLGDDVAPTLEDVRIESGEILAEGLDQVDGNQERRRLGLYAVSVQLFDAKGAALAGLEQPREVIQPDRLPADESATERFYTLDSGITVQGARARHHRARRASRAVRLSARCVACAGCGQLQSARDCPRHQRQCSAARTGDQREMNLSGDPAACCRRQDSWR